MKLYDQTSSLFWLLVSVAVFIESIRLGIGDLHNPGRGFLTFGASGILGISRLRLTHPGFLSERGAGARAPLRGNDVEKGAFRSDRALAVCMDDADGGLSPQHICFDVAPFLGARKEEDRLGFGLLCFEYFSHLCCLFQMA